MSGPLHAPTVLFLYPFRFRDPVSGKWIARCVAERHVLAQRYTEAEIIGEPEIRRLEGGSSFNPWRSTT